MKYIELLQCILLMVSMVINLTVTVKTVEKRLNNEVRGYAEQAEQWFVIIDGCK